jgi:hypothetical protein
VKNRATKFSTSFSGWEPIRTRKEAAAGEKTGKTQKGD